MLREKVQAETLKCGTCEAEIPRLQNSGGLARSSEGVGLRLAKTNLSEGANRFEVFILPTVSNGRMSFKIP
jgi:hypothetical protein